MPAAPAIITATWLHEHKACREHVEIFSAEWPYGTPLTAASITRAAELWLDLNWFARRFLKPTAWRVYEESTATARRVFEESTATARRVFGESTATALIEALGLSTEPIP